MSWLWLWCVACVAGAAVVAGQPGTRATVMGDLYWCSTLCMCRRGSQEQLHCFSRRQLYELVGLGDKQMMQLERRRWPVEDKLRWCNDLCLCHVHSNAEFQCTSQDTLGPFLDSTVGDQRWARPDLHEHRAQVEAYVVEEEEADLVVEEEEEADLVVEEEAPPVVEEEEAEVAVTEATSTTRRSEERKKKKQKKDKKQRKQDHEEEEEEPEEAEVSVTPQTPEVTTDPAGPLEADAEVLPQHEAVASSPAAVAKQPSTRRHSIHPSTHSIHPSTHSIHPSSHSTQPTTASSPLAPEVSAVREVPLERKTVALKVSQDLEGLGHTVLQIRSDVVLNQRILLVTVAVAGVAMLGVLILAVHACARRRQGSQDDATREEHKAKITREEAW